MMCIVLRLNLSEAAYYNNILHNNYMQVAVDGQNKTQHNKTVSGVYFLRVSQTRRR